MAALHMTLAEEEDKDESDDHEDGSYDTANDATVYASWLLGSV
jgi:hypothetical protein